MSRQDMAAMLGTRPETVARTLREILPEEAAIANPVDMIASADAARYRAVLETVLPDPNVDAVGFDLYPSSASDLAKVDAYDAVARAHPEKEFWISEFGLETIQFGQEAQAREHQDGGHPAQRAEALAEHELEPEARCERAELTTELADLAQGAADALALDYAGVDLMPSVAGPVVIEVNGVALTRLSARASGRGVQAETGGDVAEFLWVALDVDGADAAGLGTVEIAAMKREGYDAETAASITAASPVRNQAPSEEAAVASGRFR